MPTYDYRCTACAHRFEARQSFHDDPVAQCPTCGEKSERLITTVAVHFKGSGFYKTDYKSGNGRASSNGNGKSDSGDTKTEAKTEAKAEAKSESKSSSSTTAVESSKGSKSKEAAAKLDK